MNTIINSNVYQLVDHLKTSGWNPSENDVNGVNSFGMRPVDVAAQAGNVDEFLAIVSHPRFEIRGTRIRYFASMLRDYRGDADDRAAYARLLPHIVTLENRQHAVSA
ncbi:MULTISPECIES: hypothetical protein [unclassified Paraburkholderia]|uniref:hypothetical protein n=1 Tax=unclassified Paraburkholderia TaxID=2615204 RepID=UPI002AAF97C4|nr:MULTISPECIES: hypothetical protein [unclassified Paraburkholderia]